MATILSKIFAWSGMAASCLHPKVAHLGFSMMTEADL
jgi:hypothetical protein